MEQRLKNTTVVWIGSEQGGETLLDACSQEGAQVERQPLIVFGPPDDPATLSKFVENLSRFSWIVFTSAQAVRAMAGTSPPGAKVAAVGPSTRDALHSIGWKVDLLPSRNDSLGLLREFQKISKPRKPVLFVRGDRAKRTLPEGLRDLDFPLEEVVAYATREVDKERAQEIGQRLADVADVVLAGSPIGVETLEKAVGRGRLGALRPEIKWVCLGETTFVALRKAGVAEPVFPDAVTPAAVVEGIVSALQRETKI